MPGCRLKAVLTVVVHLKPMLWICPLQCPDLEIRRPLLVRCPVLGCRLVKIWALYLYLSFELSMCWTWDQACPKVELPSLGSGQRHSRRRWFKGQSSLLEKDCGVRAVQIGWTSLSPDLEQRQPKFGLQVGPYLNVSSLVSWARCGSGVVVS